MKFRSRRFVGSLLLCLLVFMVAFACGAEEATNQIAIVLPAEDGFQSLLSEKGINLQEVLDIVINTAERVGDSITLLGATSNNNLSTLRYRTGEGGSIDWGKIPTKGTANTFRYTINSLEKEENNDFDRIAVISGKFAKIDGNAINRFSMYVPTYLYQTIDFEDGSTLVDQYLSVSDMTISGQKGTDEFGSPIYLVTQKNAKEPIEIHSIELQNDPAEEYLDSMLSGLVFDGIIPIDYNSFKIPVSYVDEIYLMLRGNQLEDMKLVSPDGTRYPFVIGNQTQERILNGQIYPFSGQQVQVMSLKPIMTNGVWKVESSGEIKGAELLYILKKNSNVLIESAELVDSHIDNTDIEKGFQTFTTISDSTIDDLFALYPSSRLRVTDTVNGAIETEGTATDEQPNQLNISFKTAGKHTLTFRLINKEQEIIKQVISLNVSDKAPVYNRAEDEEFIIFPDTLDTNEWKCSVEGWFSDPDGDAITISKAGGDSNRISFEENTLILHLQDNMLDGSEDVILIAKADAEEIKKTVRIVWRNLKTQINSIRFQPSIETINADDPLKKRTPVRVKIDIGYDGPDDAMILEELQNCIAVLKDRDDKIVAEASFDKENVRFVTDEFMLPSNRGEYSWTLSLDSKENSLPVWHLSKETEKIKIENHAPVSNPDLLSDALFGEQYVFDTNEWGFDIPRELITDSDSDPITYRIIITEKGQSKTETNTYQTIDEIGRITIPQFGDYSITIQGNDNDGIACEEVTREIHLTNLKEALENLQGSIAAVPEKEQYPKHDTVKLILQINDKDWSEKKATVIKDWIKKSRKDVTLNGTVIQDVKTVFNSENMTITSDIVVPDKDNIFEYQIILRNQTEDKTEVLVNASEPYSIKVINRQPELSENATFGDTDVWVMKAEEYNELVIPADSFHDLDDDAIQYKLKMVVKNGQNQEEQENIIELPYTFSFEPFGFFELSREYEATILASDGDAEATRFMFTIKLHNQQLLYIIIGAVILLLLIIVIIIIVAIHRNNLPEFKGYLYFMYNNKPISKDINLKPWKKQKSIPLKIFAGSIPILLDSEQWDKMKMLELRPSKTDGFNLFQVKAKSNAPEDFPYDLSNGLSVNRKRESSNYSETTSTHTLQETEV